LVDPLIADDLEAVCGVEQQDSVGEGEVVGSLVQDAEQHEGG